MAGIEVVQQHTRGYSETGQVSERSESFIKVLASFRNGTLRYLKGAPLSVFMCIALHEADDQPGCSLTTLCDETGFSRPSVLRSLRMLSDNTQRFIEEAGLESDGTKRYRVTAFAWFGKNHPPVKRCVESDGGGKKFLLGGSKNFLPPHDHEMNDMNVHSFEKSFIHDAAETKKILAHAGISGKNLDSLARIVTPEIAETWAKWLAHVDRTRWTRPEGFVFKRLFENPRERAPETTEPAPPARASHPSITGRLARLNAEGKLDAS